MSRGLPIDGQSAMCCRRFQMHKSPSDLRREYLRYLECKKENRSIVGLLDIEIIYPMLRYLGASGDAPHYGLDAPSNGGATHHYTCVHLDRNTGVCGIYEIRPEMCREYATNHVCDFGDCTSRQMCNGIRAHEQRVREAFKKPEPTKEKATIILKTDKEIIQQMDTEYEVQPSMRTWKKDIEGLESKTGTVINTDNTLGGHLERMGGPSQKPRLSEAVKNHPSWDKYAGHSIPTNKQIAKLLLKGWKPHNRQITFWESDGECFRVVGKKYVIQTLDHILCSWREALVVQDIYKTLARCEGPVCKHNGTDVKKSEE